MKMANIQVCRICLAHDTRMCSIANTKLQEFYEKNTNKPFNTHDGRLSLVCYICYHLLKKCHRFIESAIKADEVLQEIYNNKTEITGKSFTMIDKKFFFARLKQSPVIHTAIEECLTFHIEIVEESKKEDNKGYLGVKQEQSDSETTDQEYEATDDYFEVPIEVDFGIEKELDMKRSEKIHVDVDQLEAKKAEVTDKKNKQRLLEGTHSQEFHEIILSKEEKIQQLLKRAHKYKHLLYKCHLCYRGFVDDEPYRNHMKKHDQSSGAFECDVCHYRYPTARRLLQHAKVFHRKYVCNECEHWSPTVCLAKQHYKWLHSPSNETEGTERIEDDFEMKKGTEIDISGAEEDCMSVDPPQSKKADGSETCKEPIKDSSFVEVTSRKKTEQKPQKGRCSREFHEILLSKEEQIQNFLEWKNLKYKHLLYKCRLCHSGFLDDEGLQTHKIIHEESSGAFECDVCHYRYLTARQLQQHSNVFHRKFVCNKCQHWSSTVVLARQHYKLQHGSPDEPEGIGSEFICNHCGGKFTELSLLMQHIKTHVKRQVYDEILVQTKKEKMLQAQNNTAENRGGVKSEQIGVPAPTKTDLEETKRPDIKHLICNYCGEIIPDISNLWMHIKSIHPDKKQWNMGNEIDNKKQSSLRMHNDKIKKQYLSNYCGKVIPHNDDLAAFKIHTDENPYSCNYCGVKTAQLSNLIQHLKRHMKVDKSDLIKHKKHDQKKYIMCDYCGQVIRRQALKVHLRIHTGEKPFECDYCKKTFAQKQSLIKHLRMHTGEKPYTCDFCGVKISQLSNLRSHLKKHTGERPFTCSYCDKKFSRNNHLTLHLRIHTGEKPFECVHCNKKFTAKKYLSKHLKTHTGETKNAINVNK